MVVVLVLVVVHVHVLVVTPSILTNIVLIVSQRDGAPNVKVYSYHYHYHRYHSFVISITNVRAIDTCPTCSGVGTCNSGVNGNGACTCQVISTQPSIHLSHQFYLVVTIDDRLVEFIVRCDAMMIDP
jgi:hypothetical protein